MPGSTLLPPEPWVRLAEATEDSVLVVVRKRGSTWDMSTLSDMACLKRFV